MIADPVADGVVELRVVEESSLLDRVVLEVRVDDGTALVVNVDPGAKLPGALLDAPALAASLPVREATNDEKVVPELSEDNPKSEAKLDKASDS